MDKPDLYTLVNKLQRQDAAYVCEEFRDEIGKMSGRCLDIGSGPGDVAADFILPKLNPNTPIVCSDISELMLNFGKKKYKDNDRMTFVKLDIQTPNLPEDRLGKFDHITSFYCLNWCQDMRQVFENMFNLLQPGGTSLLLFMASNPAFNAYEVLADVPRYHPYMKDVSRYVPVFQHVVKQRKTLKTLMKDAGFDVQHCSCRERSHIFDNLNTLETFLIAMDPFMKGMPDDFKGAYKKDLIQEVVKRYIICQTDISRNEYSILSRYHVFVAYLRKPFLTK